MIYYYRKFICICFLTDQSKNLCIIIYETINHLLHSMIIPFHVTTISVFRFRK